MPKPSISGNPAAEGPHIGGAIAQSVEVDASGLSQTLQKHVDDLRSLIQCGICMKPLYEPFTLACGHTFCYSCLASWFREERANRSCPDCRAPVKTQPSPAYLVRSIVHLFTSRAELLGKGETTASHLEEQQQEAQRLNEDKSNTDIGLFRGAFKPRLPVPLPIVDHEDNVVRCPNCSWELEEDTGCVQCGYRQDWDSQADSADSAQWSETEENSEMTDYFDEEIEDGFDDVDTFDWGGHLSALPWPSFYTERLQPYVNWRAAPQTINISDGEDDDEDDEDEDDDDEDMDSFIDDDEHADGEDYESASDRSTVVGGHEGSSPAHYDESQTGSDFPISQVGGYVDTGDEVDENEEERGDEDGDPDVVGIDEDEDDDDDDDDEDPIRPPVAGQRHRVSGPTGSLMRRGAATTPWASGSRQSVAHQRTSREVPRSQHPTTTGSSVANTIDISDDSDEGPVAPTRRRGQPREWIF